MVLKLYSIYDKKSKLYHPPAYCHNQGHATRMFQTIFRKPDSVFNQYPEDFQIWELGSFDDQTAKIEVTKNPTLVCEGTVLNPQNAEYQNGNKL